MASNLSIQNSLNFVGPILKNAPLQVNNQDPAITVGNIVLGTLLGPPCKWRWNRVTVQIPITQAGGTDYQLLVPQLGTPETAWLTDSNGKIHALGIEISLAKDGNVQRPLKISAQYDDNAGNITWRMDKTPDQSYTAFVDYQVKAVLFTSTASTWGPVPDEFSYIFQWGMLAFLSLLVNDARFPIFENYFISRLLGAQDGLSEQERNIFVSNWMGLVRTVNRSQGEVQSGLAAQRR